MVRMCVLSPACLYATHKRCMYAPFFVHPLCKLFSTLDVYTRYILNMKSIYSPVWSVAVVHKQRGEGMNSIWRWDELYPPELSCVLRTKEDYDEKRSPIQSLCRV